MKFVLGDRVQYNDDYLLYEEMRGETGTVLDEMDTGEVAVRWDRYDEERHDCGGRCETGYGWYVPKLELIFLYDIEDNIGNVHLEEVL